MMKCTVVKTMFSEYIDDELSPGQKEVVDLHVRECEICRNEFDELLVVHGLFASAKSFPAPYGFSTRVMASLEGRRWSIWDSLFARPVFLRVVEVAFALVIVIIGLISGNILTARKSPSLTSTEIRQSFALDIFEAVPSNTVGGVYASMMGVENER
jgi:predicted anti-sigma-YlaC factor YlaD